MGAPTKSTTSGPKRRPTKPSAMWLTKERLKNDGATFDVVEQRIPTTFITRDFLGFADIVACTPSQGIVAIQVTSDGHSDKSKTGSNVGARQTKIECEPRAVVWMKSGGRIEVWGWGRKGARGTLKVDTLRRTRAFLGLEDRIGWTEIE